MKGSTFKASASTHLRIQDILSMDNEEDERTHFAATGCMNTLYRRLNPFKMLKSKRLLVEEERCSMNFPNESKSLAASVSDVDPSGSGECRRDMSLNLGIGCYLLQLIDSSKKELDRVTELRMQMETFVQSMKEELRVKDRGVVELCETNNLHSCSTTDAPEGPESNYLNSSLNQTSSPESLAMKVFERSTPEGIDQLVEELEAELELLQLHLDKETSLQGKLDIEEGTSQDTSSASLSLSSGEVIDPTTDPQEESSTPYLGVPPYELERKLHEVLVTRQQEQIRELEAALERARQNLQKKELEISWWKDTARLMSKHVEKSPHLMSEFNLEP